MWSVCTRQHGPHQASQAPPLRPRPRPGPGPGHRRGHRSCRCVSAVSESFQRTQNEQDLTNFGSSRPLLKASIIAFSINNLLRQPLTVCCSPEVGPGLGGEVGAGEAGRHPAVGGPRQAEDGPAAGGGRGGAGQEERYTVGPVNSHQYTTCVCCRDLMSAVSHLSRSLSDFAEERHKATEILLSHFSKYGWKKLSSVFFDYFVVFMLTTRC